MLRQRPISICVCAHTKGQSPATCNELGNALSLELIVRMQAGSSTGRELSLRYGAVKTVYSRLTLQQRGLVSQINLDLQLLHFDIRRLC